MVWEQKMAEEEREGEREGEADKVVFVWNSMDKGSRGRPQGAGKEQQQQQQQLGLMRKTGVSGAQSEEKEEGEEKEKKEEGDQRDRGATCHGCQRSAA
eukprot:1191952-Rhodomonas_salina.1